MPPACFFRLRRRAFDSLHLIKKELGQGLRPVPVLGAGDGNRTRVFGLGSGHSAIELHLLGCFTIIIQNALGVKSPSAFFQKSYRQNQPFSTVFSFFTKNCGSCANTIAMNTRAHPLNSRGVRVLPEMIHPPRAAKTLSKLIVSDATGGAA